MSSQNRVDPFQTSSRSRVWAGVGQYDGALGLAWKGVPGFGHCSLVLLFVKLTHQLSLTPPRPPAEREQYIIVEYH